MWGKNLSDIKNMAKKIGDVVAPHDSDEDEEEYSDDGEEEYYEEGEEEYSEEEEEEHQTASAKSPFGLVGMLARAMDSEQERYESSSHSNVNEFAEEEHVEEEGAFIQHQEEHVDFQPPPPPAEHAVIPPPPAEAAMASQISTASADVSEEEGERLLPTAQGSNYSQTATTVSSVGNEEPLIQQHPPPAPANSLTSLNRGRSGGDDPARNVVIRDDSYATNVSAMTPADEQDSLAAAASEPPARIALVRESGSLSPQRSPKKGVAAPAFNNSTTKSNSSNADAAPGLPLVSDSLLGDEPSTTVVRDMDGIPTVPTELQQKEEVPAAMSNEDPHNESMEDVILDAQPAAASLTLSSSSASANETAPKQPRHGSQNATSQRSTQRVDSGVLPSNSVASSTMSRTSFVPSVDLGSMVEKDGAGEEDEDDDESDEKDFVTVPSAVTDQQAQPKEEEQAATETTNTAAQAENAAPPVVENQTVVALEGGTSSTENKREKLEKRCKELKKQLVQAENHIVELQQQSSEIVDRDNTEHERMMQLFQEKEARLLQAAAEDHEQDMIALRNSMEENLSAMQRQLVEERNAFQQDRERMEMVLDEANARIEQIGRQAQEERMQSERAASKTQQQQAHALRMAEDKLAQTMALLDEKEENLKQLKGMVSDHHEGAQEAEEEMDELHTENEALHNHVESLEAECKELHNKVSILQADSDKLSHLKMELRILKEEHNREKTKVQNVAASAESNTAQLISERDEALATVRDLEFQLSASRADVDVATADTERVMTANNNLQAALEAFQNEREAEMALLEENKRHEEEATAAAHAAALEATYEAHQAEIRHIQQAADAAVKISMDEIKSLEGKLEMQRVENVQTRRSLDEAIKRLQATQDDVIDRSFMKNILLDWLTKTEKKERGQVLELMASVLHFTDEEKDRVHIDDGGGLRKFVHPPPSKADLEHLEGDNVREKFVNFLMAETDD